MSQGKLDEMDEMFHSLKKGGVSLIGQNQPTTHDQLRKSFIKRNKNPVINEKIHTLRALQSTLKVRHALTYTHTLPQPNMNCCLDYFIT